MVPKHSFLQELSSCLTSTVPDDFYNRVEKGSIRLKKASSFGFCKEGILIDGETEILKTDLVILGTGFKGVEKLRDIFVSPTFQDLIVGSPDKTVPLYRLASKIRKWFSYLLYVNNNYSFMKFSLNL